jgi:hypothetical protein
MSRSGVGTVIARKSTAKGKTYRRIWVYVPSRVSEDTAFPFHAGDPVEVAIEKDDQGMSVRPISVGKALQRGWTKRRRYSHADEGSQ